MVANYPSDTAYAWWLMEKFWLILAKIGKEHSKEVYLSYPKITGLSENIANNNYINSVIELKYPWTSLKEKKSFLRFIKDNSIGTIYLTDQPFFSIKYLILRMSGVEKILIHDHTPGDRPPARGIKKVYKTIRSILPYVNADLVIAVSEWMRLRNINTTCIPPKKCITVQNGINKISCNSVNREKVRSELGIDNDEIVFITTGRASKYKRFDYIIDAIYIAMKNNNIRMVKFVFAGDGPEFEKLNKKVVELGLQNYVKLLGFRNDIPNLLCASDCAIHASLGEGFSLSILEYMSAGLVVLVPNIPSVSQAIDDGLTGYVYDDTSVKGLTDQIIRVIQDKDIRKQIGFNAKEKVDNIYTMERCEKEFTETIKPYL